MNKPNKDLEKLHKLGNKCYLDIKASVAGVLESSKYNISKKHQLLTLSDVRDLIDFYRSCKFADNTEWARLYSMMESFDTDVREDYIPSSIYNLIDKVANEYE